MKRRRNGAERAAFAFRAAVQATSQAVEVPASSRIPITSGNWRFK